MSPSGAQASPEARSPTQKNEAAKKCFGRGLRSRSKVQLKAYRRVLCLLEEKTDQRNKIAPLGRSWDDVRNDYATLKDIDRNAIRYFIEKAKLANRIDVKTQGAKVEQVLESLGLIDGSGGIKNAAILLFAKKPLKFFPCVEFRIGRFGRRESDLIIQDSVDGNILQMTDRVMEILKAKYLTSPIHYEGLQRIDV